MRSRVGPFLPGGARQSRKSNSQIAYGEVHGDESCTGTADTGTDPPGVRGGARTLGSIEDGRSLIPTSVPSSQRHAVDQKPVDYPRLARLQFTCP